jgi:hypothetical protein
VTKQNWKIKNLIATDLKNNTNMYKFVISFGGFEPTIQIISITFESSATTSFCLITQTIQLFYNSENEKKFVGFQFNCAYQIPV